MDFVVEHYNWWRAGHIIFVIFWVAALLFLPRKFIYQFQNDPDSKTFKDLIQQQKSLIKIIMNPAAIGAWFFGFLLVFSNVGRAGSWDVFLQPAWILKFIAVLIISSVHLFYLRQHVYFASGTTTYSEKFWRLLNEVPAFLVIFIVIIAVVYL